MEVLPLGVREWTCPACQTTHDRDVNTAINLKQNTVGYTGINAWGQQGSGLAGTASETGLVEPGTLQWVNTHFRSQERQQTRNSAKKGVAGEVVVFKLREIPVA